MSIEIIQDTTPKARKNYRCDACDQLLAAMVYPDEFDADDIKVMQQAEADNWKIIKGHIYSKQVNKIDGTINTFRARPEILDIYFKYDISDWI